MKINWRYVVTTAGRLSLKILLCTLPLSAMSAASSQVGFEAAYGNAYLNGHWWVVMGLLAAIGLLIQNRIVDELWNKSFQ
jgi:hypothetical protein